jgi:hypothetical protein
MPAKDLCMHAEMENLPAGNQSSQRVKKIADGQKLNGCYKYLRYGTFHITLVTSKPTSLQDKSYMHANAPPFSRCPLRQVLRSRSV